MANYYTQFSEKIEISTPEEENWIKEELADKPRNETWAEERGIEDHEFWPDFDWKILHSFEDSYSGLPKKALGMDLWIHADGIGNIENVANFARRFLAKFRPNATFTLTYSFSCSRLPVGEVGGGAIVVTAKEVYFMSSHDWVHEKLKELGV